MKSYNEIQSEYQNRRIPYSTLLTTIEWANKRKLIISRDNNTCQHCNERCIDGYIMVGYLKPFEKPARVEEVEHDFLVGYELKLVEQDSPHFAQVHHTYYIKNILPWEYPDESLKLLCHICHSKLHKEQIIPVYNDERLIDKKFLTPCSRCDGAGHFPQFEHVVNGICFKCKGACFEEWID